MRRTGDGIPCPACGGHDHTVKDSRPGVDYLRRRRYCVCGSRFTTVELMVPHIRHNASLIPAVVLQRKLNAMPDHHRKIVENLIAAFDPRPIEGEPNG